MVMKVVLIIGGEWFKGEGVDEEEDVQRAVIEVDIRLVGCVQQKREVKKMGVIRVPPWKTEDNLISKCEMLRNGQKIIHLRIIWKSQYYCYGVISKYEPLNDFLVTLNILLLKNHKLLCKMIVQTGW